MLETLIPVLREAVSEAVVGFCLIWLTKDKEGREIYERRSRGFL